MREYHSSTLEEACSHFDEINRRHTEVGASLVLAADGALMPLDFLAYAALHRSKANLSAFRMLVDCKNLIAAGPFVRMQLDSAMRFFATSLVDDPHDLVISMFGGKSIGQLRDRDGKRMSDFYIRGKLAKRVPWVERVYEHGSGYVHLSAVHLNSAVMPDDQHDDADFTRIEIRISDEQRPVPEWLWTEMVDAYCSITEMLFQFVGDWTRQKGQPNDLGDA